MAAAFAFGSASLGGMLSDNGEEYLKRYGKGTKGSGWYSFDHRGVHFVALVNVANLKAGGMSFPILSRLRRGRQKLRG